jgi:hypothetical protein
VQCRLEHLHYSLANHSEAISVTGRGGLIITIIIIIKTIKILVDRLCGLVVRVLGYRSGGPGSIPGTTRKKNSIGSGMGSIQPREYN